ncbi:hypothetical protein BV898_02900 [Hypsibius exemplaris]|uniref:Protein sleepless n=1 Tax=Hypsibius exemplaris TaxID=2072580 RepID=A0A1W0X6J8_HYPEX|nr:hypothetical protein BV898_02900 [Hypsibius exemplaris]
MGTVWRVTLWYLLFVLLASVVPSTRPEPEHHPKQTGKKDEKKKSGEEAGAGSGEEHAKEGLRCFKCDPTENNNFCRDFKPKLATPYDCAIGAEQGKAAKTASPLAVIVTPDIPFSCYKVKGDAAYGHGKVYGAKRYGCGHVTKVRTIDVATGVQECAEARLTTKGKDFFDGVICNCDNADGCNSGRPALPGYTTTRLHHDLITPLPDS